MFIVNSKATFANIGFPYMGPMTLVISIESGHLEFLIVSLLTQEIEVYGYVIVQE